MTTLRIPPGVIIGDSKASVMGRWNNANLIRWQNGKMKPVGGWNTATATLLSSVPRNGHVWYDNQFRRNAAYLCDTKIYVETQTGRLDITPTDFVGVGVNTVSRGYGVGTMSAGPYGIDDNASAISAKNLSGFPVRFGLDTWGQQLLFGSSVDGRVFYWDPSDPSTAPIRCEGLPAGDEVQDFIVTDERHLMIFGYSNFPNRIAWSGQEDRTDWDFANVTGSAGFFDLSGAGNLLCARKINGGILVWTTTSVWFGSYIGSPYFYTFKKLIEGATPVSPQSIAVFGDKALWQSANGFYLYNGGIVAAFPTTLGTSVFENMDLAHAKNVATAGFNEVYPELWFFYPKMLNGVAQAENNVYAVYNYAEDWWAPGILQRSFFTASPIDQAPLAGDTNGNIYLHERGYKDGNNPRLNQVFAEATLTFDDGLTCYTVNQGRVDPGLDDPKSVQFDVRARKTRGGPSVLKGPYVARTDGKIDLRFTASDFDFRVSGLVDAPWAFGAFVVDAVPRGKR